MIPLPRLVTARLAWLMTNDLTGHPASNRR
jgi:hypothetical protein